MIQLTLNFFYHLNDFQCDEVIIGIRTKAKQEQEHKLLFFDRQIFYLDMQNAQYFSQNRKLSPFPLTLRHNENLFVIYM